MRLLSFILLFTVQSASLVPCCGPVWGEDNTVAVADDECCGSCQDSQPSGEKGSENCSPFFTCGTCSGFFLEVHSLSFVFPAYISTSCAEYGLNVSEGFHALQWQPPKEVTA